MAVSLDCLQLCFGPRKEFFDVGMETGRRGNESFPAFSFMAYFLCELYLRLFQVVVQLKLKLSDLIWRAKRSELLP